MKTKERKIDVQDEQIIALYNARDEQAIVQTDKKYGTYCMCIAQQILQNLQDSEECVNDTWLSAWNSIPPANPPRLKHYLGKITRNLSINRYKAQSRQKRGGNQATLALHELEEIASGEPSAQSYLEKQMLAKDLNRFLYSLPVRECNVFIRRYYHVDSIESIASRYGISVANVYKILSRVRTQLRAFLQQEGWPI